MIERLIIRDASAEDALPVARIHVETWRAAYPGLVPDQYLTKLSVPDQAIAWARQISRRGGHSATLVAEIDGRVVGFVVLGPRRNSSFEHGGEIYALYVDVDWQNQGIGRALMVAAFVQLRSMGLDSALLWVLAANPSRFFYEALGGDLLGEREEPFAGATVLEVAYGWSDLGDWLASRST